MNWKYDNGHVDICRPSWDEFFLKIAYDVSERSSDSQTHCGAVIVDSSHHILSVGYNGFIADIDDSWLPNTRPDKYPWMIHAEINAILNCEHRPRGATIYVTGHPCLACYQYICQAGISKIVYDINHSIVMVDDKMKEDLEIIKYLTRHKVEPIGINYTRKTNE